MAQKFWKSMAYMGICFVFMATVIEIFQWATAH